MDALDRPNQPTANRQDQHRPPADRTTEDDQAIHSSKSREHAKDVGSQPSRPTLYVYRTSVRRVWRHRSVQARPGQPSPEIPVKAPRAVAGCSVNVKLTLTQPVREHVQAAKAPPSLI